MAVELMSGKSSQFGVAKQIGMLPTGLSFPTLIAQEEGDLIFAYLNRCIVIGFDTSSTSAHVDSCCRRTTTIENVNNLVMIIFAR